VLNECRSAVVSRQGPLGAQVLSAIWIYAAAPAVGLKSSPVLSVVCMITANFRATATAARLKPILSRSLRPHVRGLACTHPAGTSPSTCNHNGFAKRIRPMQYWYAKSLPNSEPPDQAPQSTV
jgi:hypothetical protein